MPSDLLKAFVALSVAAYGVALALAVVRRRRGPRPATMAFRVVFSVAAAGNAALVVWRAWAGHGPLADTFDAFLLLALLVSCMGVYLKLVSRHLPSELVLLPVAMACGLTALALSGAAYRQFAAGVWHVAHLTLAIAGTVFLMVAAGAGVVFLNTHRRLRTKDVRAMMPGGPSLEKMDRLMRHTLPVGFALLTLTIVAGLYGGFMADRSHWVHTWWKHPKMVVALVAWLTYGVAVHAAFGRRFRGRRAALLSVLGMLLVAVVLLFSLIAPSAGS